MWIKKWRDSHYCRLHSGSRHREEVSAATKLRTLVPGVGLVHKAAGPGTVHVERTVRRYGRRRHPMVTYASPMTRQSEFVGMLARLVGGLLRRSAPVALRLKISSPCLRVTLHRLGSRPMRKHGSEIRLWTACCGTTGNPVGQMIETRASHSQTVVAVNSDPPLLRWR
jgi:hypothetical protein